MKLAEDLRRAVLQAAIDGKLTGESQENWRFVRLGDISSYGGSIAKINAKDIPANSWLLDLEDIERGGRILRIRTAQDTVSKGDKTVFHKGDILFSKLRPYLQKVLIASSDGFCTPELIPFHCHNGIIPEYIMYFLLAPSVNNEINNASYGVKMPRVGTKTMTNLLVPLPPLEEQRRIVSRLDAILPKIAELESAENELEALERRFPCDMRDSLLQAAIDGKLTGGKREGWQWVRLRDVISLISGADLPQDQHNTVGDGIAYITGASNIVKGSLIINRWTTTPKKIAKRGDILLTCKGTIGANCVLELEEAHIARQIMAIRVTGADTKFVHYYIQHYVDTLKNQAKSMIPGIERKNITEAPFPLPPIDEQNRIVSRLNELLPLCEALEKIT